MVAPLPLPPSMRKAALKLLALGSLVLLLALAVARGRPALVAAGPATAARAEPARPPADRLPPGVFAPLLVRESAAAIGLTDEQLGALHELERAHADELQAIHERSAPLAPEVAAAFETERIDETALAPVIEALLDEERAARRAGLLLLIRTRNLLTPEQQKALRAIAEELVW